MAVAVGTGLTLMLAAGLLWGTRAELEAGRLHRAGTKAFYLAQAGVNHAYALLTSNPNFSGTQAVPLGDGSYTVTVTRLGGGHVLVFSTGTTGEAARQAVAHLKTRGTLFSRQLGINRGFTLDRRDFIGTSVFSNGNIRLEDNVVIDGEAWSAGTVTLRDSAVVTGGIYQRAPRQPFLAPDMKALKSQATVTYNSDRRFSGNQTFNDDLVYIKGELTLSGLRVTGRVTFVAEEDVVIRGEVLPADAASGIGIISAEDIVLNAATVEAALWSAGVIEFESGSVLRGTAVADELDKERSITILPSEFLRQNNALGFPPQGEPPEIIDWHETGL